MLDLQQLHYFVAVAETQSIARASERLHISQSPLSRQVIALEERLGAAGQANTRYRMDVRLDDQLEGLAVLRDDTISRERRTLRARYQLVDLATGEILLDATDGSDAGIDVVSSEYAVIAAEQTALQNLSQDLAQRMVTRVALALREQGEAPQ